MATYTRFNSANIRYDYGVRGVDTNRPVGYVHPPRRKRTDNDYTPPTMTEQQEQRRDQGDAA